MEERARSIVLAAIELAEEGGFEGVRLRDVAARAGVALGTLYRRFRSKEDLLLAALELQVWSHQQQFESEPPMGASAEVRVTAFFQTTTQAMCSRPQLARALVRAIVAGGPELSQRVAAFHGHMEELITRALRGEGVAHDLPPTEHERQVAHVLLRVWFASLIGWASGLQGVAEVVEVTESAARLILGESSALARSA